jgi:hypothetical protein
MIIDMIVGYGIGYCLIYNVVRCLFSDKVNIRYGIDWNGGCSFNRFVVIVIRWRCEPKHIR